MRVARVNVDKNVNILNNFVASNDALSEEVKTSIQENNEIIQVLLDRLSRKRIGRKSSEKSGNKKGDKKEGKRGGRNQLPSKRYPEVPVVEKELDFEQTPCCPNCGKEMKDSGFHECVETLTVIPKKYLIDRLFKKKYKCGGCHSGMLTVPTPQRIVPRSSYSDAMVLDVGLSKYCDLIPIERYAMMAERNGLEGLPANSLIGLTHHLANFLEVVYLKLKVEVRESYVIHADETPHRMLEGGGGKHWYLWGFSCEIACFFEIVDTRSGTVASGFLKQSMAYYLLSDVFSGYNKAVAEVNVYREERGIALMENAYCNAHARRKFKEAEENFSGEARTFIHSYEEIYRLEGEAKELPEKNELERRLKKRFHLEQRSKMRFYFEEMRRECRRLDGSCFPHSSVGKAIRYYDKNYEGLTRCLKDIRIELDNNREERLLRPSVVGRKTWYGNHSKRGAKTSAILFSIVEACKLNGVNPREYFPYVVDQIHRDERPLTPHEYGQKYGGKDPPQD